LIEEWQSKDLQRNEFPGLKREVRMTKKISHPGKGDRKVALMRTHMGIKEAIRESIDKIGGLGKFIKEGDTVFVKPNLIGPRDASTGAVTNPQVAKALVEIVYECRPKEILLGDSTPSAFDAEEIYDITGIKRVAEETGCTLVNLDKDKRIECIIPNAWGLKKTKVAKTILDCKKLINVPVMKTHMQSIISLGLKNMMGIVPLQWKTKLHDLKPRNGYSGVDIGIADLHRLIRPDLTVVDGITGMEGRGPLDGDPVKMDLIVSGANSVLVDAVCATIMGFDPEKIPSISLCARNDSIDLGGYQIVGLTIDSAIRPFKPCPTDVYVGENVKVLTGIACAGCLATLNIAIHRLKEEAELGNIHNLLIGIGKGPKIPNDAERVLCIGRCGITAKLPKTAREVDVVKGCPPTGIRMVEGIKKFR
jgi:uncharacterized protein (DUF362 family)